MRRRTLLVLLVFLVQGCQVARLTKKVPLDQEGEAVLYVEPLPADAARLAFELESVSAVAEGGEEHPFDLKLRNFRGDTATRQRFLASAELPPGTYAGLVVRARKATLSDEEEESALLIGPEPSRIPFSFEVRKREALLIALRFDYARSVEKGYRFAPVFGAWVPDLPVPSVIGYVTDRDAHDITVFNRTAGGVVTRIATGEGPFGVAFDRSREWAYVSLSGEGSVLRLDVGSGRILQVLRVRPGDRPTDLVLTSDGRTLLVLNPGSDTVSFLDADFLTETARVRVGNGPSSLLLDPSSRRAYVLNTLSDSISVLDATSPAVLATVSAESGPLWGAFNRQGDRLYVIHRNSPYVVTYDPSTLTVVGRNYVGPGLRYLAVDPATDLVYLSRGGDPSVGVYEPSSFLPVGRIPAAGPVGHMRVDREENNLLFLTPGRGLLTIYNLVRRQVVAELDTGEGPARVAAMEPR